jgi:hypothetical protein
VLAAATRKSRRFFCYRVCLKTADGRLLDREVFCDAYKARILPLGSDLCGDRRASIRVGSIGCDHMTCESCSTIYVCGHVYCAACEKKCVSCGSQACGNCNKSCAVCEGTPCASCGETLACSHRICPKCERRCVVCDEAACHRCGSCCALRGAFLCAQHVDRCKSCHIEQLARLMSIVSSPGVHIRAQVVAVPERAAGQVLMLSLRAVPF